MSNSKREKNLHMVAECEKFDFKMYSLRDILWFKQGHIKYTLPEDIDFLEHNEKALEKGFIKVLRRFKKNNNQ